MGFGFGFNLQHRMSTPHVSNPLVSNISSLSRVLSYRKQSQRAASAVTLPAIYVSTATTGQIGRLSPTVTISGYLKKCKRIQKAYSICISPPSQPTYGSGTSDRGDSIVFNSSGWIFLL